MSKRKNTDTQATKKVCYVLCYKYPDYTRSNSLIEALKNINGVEVIVVKNNKTGFFKYIEVPVKLLVTRVKDRPDTFVVGFRAHEIFWAFYPSMIGKPIVFDEFIDHHDWLVSEHKKGFAIKPFVYLLDLYMKIVMKLSKYVLTDTDAHAELCVKNYGVNQEKVKSIPIGADENLYYPKDEYKKSKSNKFKVLFYGSMLPLHGTDIVLDAIKKLAYDEKHSDVHLTFAGGKGKKKFISDLGEFINKNNLQENFTHIEWVNSDELPDFIRNFDLVLGGPFGNTGQGRRVVTGKTYQLLAMRMPVVVGKIENMSGFIDKKNCILIKQGDSILLADAIKWSMDNRSKLGEIAQNGRLLYQNNFSSEKIGEKLNKLI